MQHALGTETTDSVASMGGGGVRSQMTTNVSYQEKLAGREMKRFCESIRNYGNLSYEEMY